MSLVEFATRRVEVLAGGVIVVAGLVIVGVLFREPTFEGKTARSWLMDAAYARNYATGKRALEFFKRTSSRQCRVSSVSSKVVVSDLRRGSKGMLGCLAICHPPPKRQ
jgi:hypothetical protein